MTDFRFEVVHQSKLSRARVGRIHTAHGIIDTPNFVAVGTNGTLKAMDNTLVDEIGLQLMFCNTYHLMVQPGTEVVRQAGGLHKFINRRGPIITDSGGFQVFSLAYGGVASEIKSQGLKRTDGLVKKISEEGVVFLSYRDGSRLLLTPESSVQAQKDLGADIIIPFDELLPYHIGRRELIKSLERTHRWEKRSLETHLADPQGQAMYAVIHGGIDPDLRRQSCEYLGSQAFDGFAIGGSVGKNREEMVEVVRFTVPLLPPEKPNHLLGIGDLPSLERTIPLGIDTMDSSYPTRAARHGTLFTKQGELKVGRRAHSKEMGPPCKSCNCHTCRNFSLAYLHHLFKANELTAQKLASIHNLHYMVELMADYRQRILDGKL